MIERLYVHNFRCLENFELRLAGNRSVLLIGDSGSGKSTVGLALRLLQSIARGTNRIRELLGIRDVTRGRTDTPARFELEARIGTGRYHYTIAFELPAGFKEMRVLEERLTVDGEPVYTRELATVRLARSSRQSEADFRIDWHLAALPVIQQQSADDPLAVFKFWLARMLVLRPVPSMISGESNDETLQPSLELMDFGAWFTGLLAYSPSAYTTIDEYLKQVMPDLKDIKNPAVGQDARRLELQFANEQTTLHVPFADLSDGEKCFLIAALVLAANRAYGPLCCFWDEPDSHLAPAEVGHFVMALRRAFQAGGQLIATSHNAEAIRQFGDENTLVLQRRNHLEPTTVRGLGEVGYRGDLVGALVRGDLRA